MSSTNPNIPSSASAKQQQQPAPHTLTSVYRNTTLGLTLQQTLQEFSSRNSIPKSLNQDILGVFDEVMCEMMSNGRVRGGKGALGEDLNKRDAIQRAHPDLFPDQEAMKQQKTDLAKLPMAPLGRATLNNATVDMYRYVNKCYEFILQDVDLELDVSGREPKPKSSSKSKASVQHEEDRPVLRMKSDRLKVVAVQTSDLLRQQVLKGQKRKRK